MMKKNRILSILILGLLLSSAADAAHPASVDGNSNQPIALVRQLRARAFARDFLGARVLVRRLVPHRANFVIWKATRDTLLRYPEVGNDIILGWERVRPALNDQGQVQTPIEQNLARADDLLLAGKNLEAFELYQSVAQWLKARMQYRAKLGKNPEILYPYVLHGMARALYGAGRYADALRVYTWFTPDYPRFRQTLFEKMWAAVRYGQIDEALGAIASQRSDFFSRFMDPEAYLIQIYLYKALCRKDDIKRTMDEVSEFKRRIESGTHDYLEWAKSDFEMRALANLAEIQVLSDVPPVTLTERATEQNKLRKFLQVSYEFARRRLTEHLTLIEAYARLAATPGIGSGFKDIEKLPSREELFRRNLEIWPADDAEVWIDEVGRHRFVGQSLCGKEPAPGAPVYPNGAAAE